MKIVNDNLIYLQYHTIFSQWLIKVQGGGFLNKKSNCWVSSLLQVFFYSTLPNCLPVSKGPFAATLCSLFQNMAKDTLLPVDRRT